MDERRIPLFDLKLSAEAKRQVREVMASGWLNTGPKVKAFEKAIASMAHVRHAVAVNSATAGLQLTLEALGIGPGKEVITSPFTFVATAAVILRVGATPVFADIDPATFALDPDEVKRKISPRTGAVMPVDIAGHPADYTRLGPLCSQYHVPLIADAAHSLSGGVKRKSVAQLADVAVHSFQATKNLTTADGGIVLSKHKILVDHVRLLAQHGMTATAHQRKKSQRWEYDVVGLGQKANLSDLHAAVGLGQLSVFEKNQARRVRLAERYLKQLADLGEFVELPVVRPHFRHAWHLFIIRLHLSRLRIKRNRFVALMAEAGIECGVHYKPLFELSFYRELGYLPQHFPNTAYVGERVLTLPLYPGLGTADVDRVCDRIRAIVARYGR
jgi:dTDP-4-amino-4,6-dideoxygalactose transaminase